MKKPNKKGSLKFLNKNLCFILLLRLSLVLDRIIVSERGRRSCTGLSACLIMVFSSIGATGCLLVKNNFPKYLFLLFFAI